MGGRPPIARARAARPADAADALVGRDAELAELRDALAAARRGAGRFAELVGEPGIGKTRLLEAVRRRTPSAAPCPLATCEARGGASPYAPWRELLVP